MNFKFLIFIILFNCNIFCSEKVIDSEDTVYLTSLASFKFHDLVNQKPEFVTKVIIKEKFEDGNVVQYEEELPSSCFYEDGVFLENGAQMTLNGKKFKFMSNVPSKELREHLKQLEKEFWKKVDSRCIIL